MRSGALIAYSSHYSCLEMRKARVDGFPGRACLDDKTGALGEQAAWNGDVSGNQR